jgi:hypothetical protein
MNYVCKTTNNGLLSIVNELKMYENLIVPSQIEGVAYSVLNEANMIFLNSNSTKSLKQVKNELQTKIETLRLVSVYTGINNQKMGTNTIINGYKIFLRPNYTYKVVVPLTLANFVNYSDIDNKALFMKNNFDEKELSSVLFSTLRKVIKDNEITDLKKIKSFTKNITSLVIENTKLYLFQTLGIEILDLYLDEIDIKEMEK